MVRIPDPQAPDLDQAAADAKLVARGFWPKLRRCLARLPFAGDMLAAYFCATDTQTPVRTKAILMAALAYFVLPVDLIPDFVTGLGFTDDAAVLMLAVRAVGSQIQPGHRDRAQAALAALADQPPPA